MLATTSGTTSRPGAAISVSGLDVAYGRQTILQGLSLDVEPGSFVALLGSSGCGKTTLLRAISGFVRAIRGRIAVDGADITRLPPEQRGMAMVFQSYALWPHMSVAQNIGYGLRLRRMPKAFIAARVRAMLDLLGLAGYEDRRVTDMSGGQRQRVALGRALAVDPRILLLDEPLSNLDAKIRLAMRHEIRSIQQSLGLTAVHVTHDQEEAMVMADRIVILDQGRIVQDGAPEAVYRRPVSPFVAAFLGADNVIAARATPRPGGLDLALAGGIAADLPGAEPLEGPCVLHFRSQAARLGGDAPAPDALRLPGRVAQASYPGGRYRYAVATPAGTYFVDDERRAAVGDAVAIEIPVEALHVFALPQPAHGAAGNLH